MTNTIHNRLEEADNLVRLAAVQMMAWEDQARTWRTRFIRAIWICGCVIAVETSLLAGWLWNR